LENIAEYRKLCLERQTELRRVMVNPKQFSEAVQLFFLQHASLHSKKMALTQDWSYEDAILDDMTEEQIRCIPLKGEHSVVWCIWHIARIEDVAMNLLVAGSQQVYHQEDWSERLQVTERQDTGNAMDEGDMFALSESVDIETLRKYRLAVGRRTREIVKGLGPDDLNQKVDPDRLRRVMDEGALVEAAVGIRDYWGNRNIAGLLLMPASRHLLVHLNEALKIKQKCQ
jgi:hypothetical protein